MHHDIGIFDAKAKLSELLRQVQAGEWFTITVRGRPIADLVPSEVNRTLHARAAIQQMRAFPKIKTVSNRDVAAWIIEGRK